MTLDEQFQQNARFVEAWNINDSAIFADDKYVTSARSMKLKAFPEKHDY